jgi:hypothetical protein
MVLVYDETVLLLGKDGGKKEVKFVLKRTPSMLCIRQVILMFRNIFFFFFCVGRVPDHTPHFLLTSFFM